MSITERATQASRLDVRVTGGVVRGVREGSLLAWRGIPYAAPPVGPARFRAPQPVLPWTGIRDAIRYGHVAPQLYRGQFKGTGPRIASSEDCLTVNVLSATVTRRKRLGMPVMVFIHGGGYSSGSSQDFAGQGERFVLSGQVVYVSFDYRLNALGYLHFGRYGTSERPVESNLGLRDQVAALEWVRDNIRGFGGDPHNVTIFGESAGGNAVTTLMATPAARGLFARAIAQSAPTDAVYRTELADGWAAEFVEILAAQVGGEADALRLLETASVADLTTAALVLQIRTPDASPGTFCLAPVIDGDFLPEHPVDAFRAGRQHPVPLIIGTNDREGSIFRGRVDILPKSPERVSAIFLRAGPASRTRMLAAYPGLAAKQRAAADFAGDYAFWYPSVLVGGLHSRVAPVHFYRFDVAPRIMRLLGLDATHGIEMFALFSRVDTLVARTMTSLGGRDDFVRAGERMRRNWLQFACTGRLGDGWPAYTEEVRTTLIIAERDRVESDPRAQRRLAWEAFSTEAHENEAP
ncbi:carboxylesterase/lipase family protein [Glaciibacter sp. 2TAF33]|uniref:carboxylesterase/lipase family protein n=1 Tax=Glaciibacter sp. 2TAF33 TaxID=3233015 RepID=UPI003F8F703F